MSDNLFIVKRNGKRQRFVYEKLLISIFVSLDKGKENDNGDNAKLAKMIAEKIITSLLSLQTKDVRTSTIIELIYFELLKVHKYFAEKYMFYSEYRMKILNEILSKKK